MPLNLWCQQKHLLLCLVRWSSLAQRLCMTLLRQFPCKGMPVFLLCRFPPLFLLEPCCCCRQGASAVSGSVRPHRRQPTRLRHPWDSPGKNTGVGCHFLLQCMKVKSESEVAQSCPTLSDPMDHSLPGSSIHGLFQARVLEWGAIAFSVQIHNQSQMTLGRTSAMSTLGGKGLHNQEMARFCSLILGKSQGICVGIDYEKLGQKRRNVILNFGLLYWCGCIFQRFWIHCSSWCSQE